MARPSLLISEVAATLTDTGWITPTLLNGWVDYSATFNSCQYRKVGSTVYIKGTVKNGTPGATSSIFILPDDCRPLRRSSHLAATDTGTYGQVDVDPSSGAVIAVAGTSTQLAVELSFVSDLAAETPPPPPIGDLTWQSDSTVTTTATTVSKTSGATAWDAQAYSDQSLAGGCYLEFKADAANNNAMISLNTDPATDSSYTSLDYAFFTQSQGNLYVFESGSSQGVVGTYNALDTLAIEYVGTEVRYYKNDVVVRTATGVATGLTMYIDSSLNTVGSGYNSIVFRAVK